MVGAALVVVPVEVTSKSCGTCQLRAFRRGERIAVCELGHVLRPPGAPRRENAECRYALMRGRHGMASADRIAGEHFDQTITHRRLLVQGQVANSRSKPPFVDCSNLIERNVAVNAAHSNRHTRWPSPAHRGQRRDEHGAQRFIGLIGRDDHAGTRFAYLGPEHGVQPHDPNLEPPHHSSSLRGASSQSASSSVIGPGAAAKASAQPRLGVVDGASTMWPSCTHRSASVPKPTCSRIAFGKRTPRELPIATIGTFIHQ